MKIAKKSQKKFIVPTRSSPCPAAGLPAAVCDPIIVESISSCDILHIDKRIKDKFIQQKTEIPMLNQEIAQLNDEITHVRLISRLRDLESRKSYIIRKMSDINLDIEVKKYINATQYIIEAYLAIGNVPSIIDAMSSSSLIMNTEERRLEKLVDSYLKIASEYIYVIIEVGPSKYIADDCSLCGQSLIGTKMMTTGARICLNDSCRGENRFQGSTQMPPKEYDTWKNLLKAHYRYTGKAAVKFNVDVIMGDLDIYFTSIGGHDGQYYRSMPVNKFGRKDGTSHEDICNAFKKLGYAQFYKDYMYVCRKYYGWILPDLAHLESIMEVNFRRKQEEWDKMTIEERGGKSALATGYRLCREYQHAGFHCTLDEFKVSSKKITLNRYDRAYNIMCTRAGFKFVEITSIT